MGGLERTNELMSMLLTCGAEKAGDGYGYGWLQPSVESCRRWLNVLKEDSEDVPNVYADSELSTMTTAIVYAKWRQFCVTSEGRFGWVPEGARVGDKICVLLGGKVPVAIGECGRGHYEMRGEAFIHGIMNAWRSSGLWIA